MKKAEIVLKLNEKEIINYSKEKKRKKTNIYSK
jgi:hypothetical protein